MKVAGKFEAKNFSLNGRIVFPPMATTKSSSGCVNEDLIEHYKRIAGNKNVSLIITEHAHVSSQGRADPNQVSFASDDVIESQKKLIEEIRKVNPEIKIFAQISHAGAKTTSLITGEELVSASPITFEEKSRSLSIDEIIQIQDLFRDAAIRVKKAGYDGVEIHCAHGYLLNQFYSPLTNFREDEYGHTSIENRIRFLTEIVDKTRVALGEDYPIAVRLGGCDYMEGGSSIADAVEAAKILEQKGIDLLDISGGLCGYNRKEHGFGWFSDTSSAIKREVSLPILVTGGVRTLEQAETLLEEEKSDLVGVGRSLFKNPNWEII